MACDGSRHAMQRTLAVAMGSTLDEVDAIYARGVVTGPSRTSAQVRQDTAATMDMMQIFDRHKIARPTHTKKALKIPAAASHAGYAALHAAYKACQCPLCGRFMSTAGAGCRPCQDAPSMLTGDMPISPEVMTMVNRLANANDHPWAFPEGTAWDTATTAQELQESVWQRMGMTGDEPEAMAIQFPDVDVVRGSCVRVVHQSNDPVRLSWTVTDDGYGKPIVNWYEPGAIPDFDQVQPPLPPQSRGTGMSMTRTRGERVAQSSRDTRERPSSVVHTPVRPVRATASVLPVPPVVAAVTVPVGMLPGNDGATGGREHGPNRHMHLDPTPPPPVGVPRPPVVPYPPRPDTQPVVVARVPTTEETDTTVHPIEDAAYDTDATEPFDDPSDPFSPTYEHPIGDTEDDTYSTEPFDAPLLPMTDTEYHENMALFADQVTRAGGWRRKDLHDMVADNQRLYQDAHDDTSVRNPDLRAGDRAMFAQHQADAIRYLRAQEPPLGDAAAARPDQTGYQTALVQVARKAGCVRCGYITLQAAGAACAHCIHDATITPQSAPTTVRANAGRLLHTTLHAIMQPTTPPLIPFAGMQGNSVADERDMVAHMPDITAAEWSTRLAAASPTDQAMLERLTQEVPPNTLWNQALLNGSCTPRTYLTHALDQAMAMHRTTRRDADETTAGMWSLAGESPPWDPRR